MKTTKMCTPFPPKIFNLFFKRIFNLYTQHGLSLTSLRSGATCSTHSASQVPLNLYTLNEWRVQHVNCILIKLLQNGKSEVQGKEQIRDQDL